MLGSSIAQAVVSVNLLNGRAVPPWALRMLVRGAARTVAQRPFTGQGAEGFVADGPSAFVDVLPTRFMKQVAFAAREVPMYRERLGDVSGLDRHTLPSLDEVPVTTREDLASAGARAVAASASPVVAHGSSGTTGEPVRVWFGAAEVELMASLAALADLASGSGRPDDVTAICMAPGVAQSAAIRSAQLVGSVVLPLDLLDARALVTRLVTPVDLPGHASRPTVLVAVASVLAEILVVAEQEGLGGQDFGLRSVAYGGEVGCAPELARRAARVFGPAVTVTEGYGATEVAPVSGSVCEAGHLHFSPATGLVEVKALGEDRWAQPGELGTLVVTPLAPFRSTTPLVRYDTDDLVTALGEDPRTCSQSAMPATSPVLGKAADLALIGGAAVTPRALLDVLSGGSDVPFPLRHGVRSDPLPGLAIVVESTGAASAASVAAEARALLDRAGLGAMSVETVDGPAALERWREGHGGRVLPLKADRVEGILAAGSRSRAALR